MTHGFESPGSLGNEVTRAGDPSPPDQPRQPGEMEASLGEQETGVDSRLSLSDLADLGDDGDEPQEIVDLKSRYEILDALGEGGMGEVVRAADRRLKREVAIKRMRTELGASRQAMRRFLTEAVSVAALNHFNVVQIYDYGHTTEGPFLVMELVEGPTLADSLREGPLPLEEAVDMACQLCDGLQAAHDRGIIHRDIKPANILVAGSGIPKLTDFGLAKEVADTGHTQAGAVLGTLDYMSPEQKADSTRADARSDQWSLAATFYQMVTGERPRIIDTDLIPEPVRDVVRQALKANPEERFESVRLFGEALQDAINPSGEPAFDRATLQEGQCAGCGTVNDLARQFCRGCGAGLEETCPECGAGEKVWEQFCGKCGTDIPAVLEEQIESARELPGDVQSLRSDYRHAEALEKIAPLLEWSHPALEEQREWSEKTRHQLAGELAELESQREQLLQAAREQLESGKFSEARKYLAQIPRPLQNDESRHLDDRLVETIAEIRRLAGEIREATRTRSYIGLDTKLERYVELKPQDDKARRLLEKVRERFRRNQPEPSAAAAEGQDSPPTARPALTENPVLSPSSSKRIGEIAGGMAAALLMAFSWQLLSGGRVEPIDGINTAVPEDNSQQSSTSPVSAVPDLKKEKTSSQPVVEASTKSNASDPLPADTAAPVRIPLTDTDAAPPQFDSTTAARTATEAQAAQQMWAAHLERKVVEINSIGMNLTLIPPGEFLMGSPNSDHEADDDEHPQHRIRITRPFYLPTTEITQAQWKTVMQTEPWKGEEYVREGDDFAATYISWEDAQEFCRKLSQKEGVTYRLPTEAEWEYTCRAGTTTRYHFGDDAGQLGEYAWFDDNADDIDEKYAHQVDRKKPNAWGLYDMHGNVNEWCQDGYDKDYYQQFATRSAVDPQGPSSEVSSRVYRGGGWSFSARNSRAAYRGRYSPVRRNYFLGFRVVRELPGH